MRETATDTPIWLAMDPRSTNSCGCCEEIHEALFMMKSCLICVTQPSLQLAANASKLPSNTTHNMIDLLLGGMLKATVLKTIMRTLAATIVVMLVRRLPKMWLMLIMVVILWWIFN
jgi:hypothetical protein